MEANPQATFNDKHCAHSCYTSRVKFCSLSQRDGFVEMSSYHYCGKCIHLTTQNFKTKSFMLFSAN